MAMDPVDVALAESIMITTGGGVPTSVDGRLMTDRSGDLWELQTKRRDFFISGEGKYLITFRELHRFLYQHRLTAEAAAILNWLCANVEHRNKVTGVSHQRVTADTGIVQPNISRSLKKLVELEIARKADKAEYLLNPRYLFKGTPSQQKEAVRQWDEQKVIDQTMEVK